MSLRESVFTALDALWANKLRSLLTMLGIIIGVAAVIAVVAIGRGGQSLILGEFENLGSGVMWIEPNWAELMGDSEAFKRLEYLTEADVRAVRAVAGVARVSPEIDASVTLKAGRESGTTTARGVGADYLEINKLNLLRGRFFSPVEVDRAVRVTVIGEETEQKYYGAGRGLGRSLRINGLPYTVVGVLEKPKGLFAQMGMGGKSELFIPHSTVRRLVGEKDIIVAFVQPVSTDRATDVKAAVQSLIDQRRGADKFNVGSVEQMVGAFRKVTDVLTGIIGGIAAIALLVGGIGIMNIMLVSVTERTREIGIRKALGARRRDILRQFLIEAVVLAVAGGLVGMAMGGALATVAGKLLKLPPLFTWQTVLLAVSVSAGVGILFGVYPANRAARLDPIEALRYE